MQLPIRESLKQSIRGHSLLVIGAWTVFGLAHGLLWAAALERPLAAFVWTVPTALGVAAVWAIATPFVFEVTWRLSPARVGWLMSLTGHASLALSLVVTATTVRAHLMAVLSGVPLPSLWLHVVWWLDVWLFAYATLVVIARTIDHRRHYVDRTIRANQLEAQLARAQLQYLESQLQPHFLFNALNTIQELAHEAPRSAERMLQRLRTLLTVSLSRYGQDEVTLSEELEGLEPYLDIQRTRFSNWLTVEVDVPDEVRSALVPHLILQPLVENSIKHGLAVRPSPGQVIIRARRTRSELVVSVVDDGVGLTPKGAGTRDRGSGGIGLSNVGERLRQLYGIDQRFDLRARAEGGVIVEVTIPLRLGASSRSSVAGSLPSMASPVAPAMCDRELDELTGVAEAADASENADVSPVAYETSPTLSVRSWLGIAGVWAALAVLWTNQMVLYAESESSSMAYSVWAVARLQLVTSAIWMTLSMPVLWMARRFRLTAEKWATRLPIHVAAAVGVGFAHMAIVKAVGVSGAPLLAASNLNPLTGDIFIYLGLLAWSHSRDFVAWYRARDVESTRLSARVARSRFHALRVQLRPAFLLSTLDRLCELVHTDVARTERLIARLADTLRLTLDLGREATVSLARELSLVSASIEAHRLGIRPGTQLVHSIEDDVLADAVPSRLLCTVIDELLANVPGDAATPLTVHIQGLRVSGCTQLCVEAVTEQQPPPGAVHLWWSSSGIAERAVRSADPMVSLFMQGTSAVVIMIGQGSPAEAHPGTEPLLAGAVA